MYFPAQSGKKDDWLSHITVQWTLPSGESSCDCSPQSLKHVAVIGGGTMGRGIAISLCLAGYETILIENDQEVRTCLVSVMLCHLSFFYKYCSVDQKP